LGVLKCEEPNPKLNQSFYQIKEKKLKLGVTKNEDGCKQDFLYILAKFFST
jgi:hypothetical protein